MIIHQLFMIWFYFISVLLFLNFSSPFIFWMVMEINLLLFICLMISWKDMSFYKEFQDLMVFYFIIQSIASIFFLSDFFFSLDFYMFNFSSMFLLAMLMKLAMFPFFFWIFKVCDYINYPSLALMLGIQKVPFFLALYSSFSKILVLLIVGSFFFGSLMILFSDNLIHMLVCSSITYSFWIFYIHNVSVFLFLFFFLIYGMAIFFLLKFYSFSNKSLGFFMLLAMFMFLLGLPPFSIFFFKFMAVQFILDSFGFTEMLFFWFFSVLTLLGYSKFSFNSFFFSFNYYNEVSVLMNMQILFCGISSIFFLKFLFY